MGINLVVAVTDGQWFERLRRKPELPEVNFWAPNPRGFRALDRGELFLFKLHAPHDVIVGGGVFTYANVLPCSLAWQAFGEANGAESAEEMRQRIVRYRGHAGGNRRDFEISGRIREEFENGRDYYALQGRRIHAPVAARQRPDPVALTWHNENCFVG